MSSNLPFHIFISSTHYNLVDLRAELARYLIELGYNPLVSSEAGFPEYTPEMNPWESCLRVVEDSHLMVLILDGRYGAPLPWKQFKGIIDDKISPTHGEYRLAHHLKKKILVFVRAELLVTYNIYRQVVKNNTNETGEVNTVSVHKEMEKLLPKDVELRALEFLNEVKTTRMIPWIMGFNDLTDIKTEIKHQLVNQLVDAYKQKEKSLDVMVAAFDQVLQELTEEKQQEVLGKLGLTKNLLDELEESKLEATKLRKSLQELQIAKQKETAPLKARELAWTERVLQDQYRSVITKIGTEQDIIFNRVIDQSPSDMNYTSFYGSDMRTNIFQSGGSYSDPPTAYYTGSLNAGGIKSESILTGASNYLFQPISGKVEPNDWSSVLSKNDIGNYVLQSPVIQNPLWAIDNIKPASISALTTIPTLSVLPNQWPASIGQINPAVAPYYISNAPRQLGLNSVDIQLNSLNQMEVVIPRLIPDNMLNTMVKQDLFRYHKDTTISGQVDELISKSDGNDKPIQALTLKKKKLTKKKATKKK